MFLVLFLYVGWFRLGGVATSKTAEEMKSEEFAKLLGEDFKYDSGLNDGYPVLVEIN